jgi:hypothetical protein
MAGDDQLEWRRRVYRSGCDHEASVDLRPEKLGRGGGHRRRCLTDGNAPVAQAFPPARFSYWSGQRAKNERAWIDRVNTSADYCQEVVS